MNSEPIKRLIVAGDTYGVPEILSRVPNEIVVGIVAAEIRPQYHKELELISTKLSIPLVVQPRPGSPDYPDFLVKLLSLHADGLICNGYSMLFQSDVLSLVNGRAFNVHMALLPRNRGPNPIQWAIIHGDDTTGVTLHLMDDGFDSGSIVDQEAIDILDQDTWVTLLSRLKIATSKLLERAIPALLNGHWKSVQQDEKQTLHNRRISPESFEIDFGRMSDLQIFNLVRAQVAPLNGAYLDTASRRRRFLDPLSLGKVAELRKYYG